MRKKARKEEHRAEKENEEVEGVTSRLQSGRLKEEEDEGRSEETTSSFDGAAVFRMLDHGDSPRKFMETHHSTSSLQTRTETHIVDA